MSAGSSMMRLVSYDVWDTILRRRCHPDAVKLFTARELLLALEGRVKPEFCDPWAFFRFRRAIELQIGKESMTNGGDCEYPLHQVLRRLIRFATTQPPADIEAWVSRFHAMELAQEKRVITLDPGILERIRRDGATRRIFISDFYMPKSAIFELLASVGVAEHFHDGYVSCDVHLNKHSGRLFDHVLRAECCPPAQMEHIGDNAQSDVESPRRRGIVVSQYLPAESQRLRQDNEARFTRRELAAVPPASHAPATSLDALAMTAAPLFVGFAQFLIFRVRQLKLPELYFFTREGEFFLRLYRALREASPFRDMLPAGRLLAVSRLATFAPSMQRLDLVELMRVWRLYWVQSPRGLLSTLGLCSDENLALFARQGLSPDQRVPRPWLDPRVQAVIADHDFRAAAEAQFAQRRELLLDYCRQEGITNAGGRYGVVDIGWRGTIQDNLALLLPKAHFSGLYLGLNQLLNPQPANLSKEAFGPRFAPDASPEVRKMLNFVAPIEMLTNSAGGSVRSYTHDGERLVPVCSTEARESRVFAHFTGEFQDAVVRVAERWAPQLSADAVGPGELRQAAIQAWHRLVQQPDPQMARAYLSLSHDETFGLGQYVDKSRHLGRLWWLRLLLSDRHRREFGVQLGMIGWTEAYAAVHRSPLLLWVARRYFQG